MKFRDKMPVYYLAAASIYGVAGMALGLYMHLTLWKRPIPFHGHLSSLGWLSLAVVGIALQILPGTRDHKLAIPMFVLLQGGTLLMLGGLPIVILGLTNIPLTIGAIMIPVGYAVFSIIMISEMFRK